MSLADLQEEVTAAFAEHHGGAPTGFVAAPGRVNLIGEHVDYNDGVVLPAAIDRWICAAVRSRTDGVFSVQDAGLGISETFCLEDLVPSERRGWLDYIKGVLAGFVRRGDSVAGFDLTFTSTIPIGGGLSSSAALEAVIALTVCYLQNLMVPRMELAQLCQRAEHEFAGVPCGLMDQAAVLLSRSDHVMLLDCQSNAVEFHPWHEDDWRLMIINSGVAHSLASGEYKLRRAWCTEAAKRLGVDSLRRIEPRDLLAALCRRELTEEMRRCVRHVVSENVRTREMVVSLARADYARAGRLLHLSHVSLRDDYRVSCAELDEIVRIAEAAEGVAGCRMMGGGFGGSAIALVQTEAATAVQREIELGYHARFSRWPEIFLCRPVAGAKAWVV
ncbi:MAG TPA: galactokinase [Candidatus Limnocylindria bacterium]|jgi:galactokinase|nr:galactokinase [Candidatus Limnocylindria bacterium]